MNREFLNRWLVTKPVIQPYSVKREIDDQLMFERHMRECVADRNILTLQELEELSKHSFSYLQNHGNWFVDFSDFYHLTKKIEFYAKTSLITKEKQELDAVLWTYGAVQIYVNQVCVSSNHVPVYKPIQRVPFKMCLNEGVNELVVRVQNLGVRDTRNIFGIQLQNSSLDVELCLPGVHNLERLEAAEQFLEDITYHTGVLNVAKPFCEPVQIKETNQMIEAGFSGDITVKKTRKLSLGISIDDQEIERIMEINENVIPLYGEKSMDLKHAHLKMFERIASLDPQLNHEAEKFSVFQILARYAAGTNRQMDRELLFKQLEQLELRIDCADFIVNGVIRLMLSYELDAEMMDRIKSALLRFRYWMDEDGEDGMCFWSENHSILFYSGLLLVSAMYPDDIFVRSGRTGRAQHEIAQKKVKQWLDDVSEHGFEEFLSGGYTVVTMAALLNLYDFAEEGIAKKAGQVLDEIMRMLVRHTFCGSLIAPQGRIYRDVLYPFEQGVQSLLHYINPSCPVFDNVWMIAFATTKYKIADEASAQMEKTLNCVYPTGNALITINKQKDYILTSVASPREDGYEPWYNNSFDDNADRSNTHYTKSINERFHGTTYFQPGVYGYQQHMWYGALDNECVAFTSHPGENVDISSMRPAYWYGNGIMPALKQNGSCLGVIYDIPENHPIHFTHLYFPKGKFDEIREDGNWLFGRKGNGFMGVWSDTRLIPYNGYMPNCEYRSYGDVSAYLCVCSSQEDIESLEEFMIKCRNMTIDFQRKERVLRVEGILELKFEQYYNKTQVI